MENTTNLKGYKLLINQDIDAYESQCDVVDIIAYSSSNDLNEAIERIELGYEKVVNSFFINHDTETIDISLVSEGDDIIFSW